MTQVTKQHLKGEIFDAYEVTQHQLHLAQEELLAAAIFGALTGALIMAALLV